MALLPTGAHLLPALWLHLQSERPPKSSLPRAHIVLGMRPDVLQIEIQASRFHVHALFQLFGQLGTSLGLLLLLNVRGSVTLLLDHRLIAIVVNEGGIGAVVVDVPRSGAFRTGVQAVVFFGHVSRSAVVDFLFTDLTLLLLLFGSGNHILVVERNN
jgi:hypothetical protein